MKAIHDPSHDVAVPDSRAERPLLGVLCLAGVLSILTYGIFGLILLAASADSSLSPLLLGIRSAIASASGAFIAARMRPSQWLLGSSLVGGFGAVLAVLAAPAAAPLMALAALIAGPLGGFLQNRFADEPSRPPE